MPLKDDGPFQIGLQTKKEQSAEALAIVKKVVADYVAQGPTETELKAAKAELPGLEKERSRHVQYYEVELDRKQAALDASDPDGDPVKITWLLQRDPGEYGSGGDSHLRSRTHLTTKPDLPEILFWMATACSRLTRRPAPSTTRTLPRKR